MGKASRKKRPSIPFTDKKEEVLSESPASFKWKASLHGTVLQAIVIVVLGLLIYSNTFNSPFQLDEEDFLVKNPLVQDLRFFSDLSAARPYPLYDALKSRYIGYLTFALNYRLDGFNVLGYHIVNLFIHIATALAVYFFVLLTLRTPYLRGWGSEAAGREGESHASAAQERQWLTGPSAAAFATAILFVTHPLQTEAVTYVFQRFASLVALFYLLSVLLYAKWRLEAEDQKEQRTEKRSVPASAYYVLSLLFAVFAMKTKENAFTLPVVVTLYEFFFFTGKWKSRALRLSPFLLCMLIVPATLIAIDQPAREIIRQTIDPGSLGFTQIPKDIYFYTQFRVLLTYIRLLFFPVNQNLWYVYPQYDSFFLPPVVLSFVLLLAIFGGSLYLFFRSWRRTNGSWLTALDSRLISFGILWFFITISVESSIIPIPMIIDEYRVYLPSVGVFLAVVIVAMALARKLPGRSVLKRGLVSAAFLLTLLTLSSTTFARNMVWMDKVSLWSDVASKSPMLLGAYDNLGLAYAARGEYEKAISIYEKCLKINPDYAFAYANMGVAYAALGRHDLSIEAFQKSLALNPNKSVSYTNLGRAYADIQRFDLAVSYYSRGVALDPLDSKAYHGMGASYDAMGRYDEALAAFNKFVELSPRDPDAYKNRAIVYTNKGDIASAVSDLQKACSLGDAESCGRLNSIQAR